MIPRKTLLAFSLVLGAAACSDGAGGTVEPEPKPTVELGMTLRRAVNSAVPSVADSALIRVWHSTGGINQLKAVAIPTPGSETRVTFAVPAQNGYSVGVIAFKHSGPYSAALAGGRTDGVNVVSGQANEAAVNVQPWQMAISGPDTLQSGQQAAYTFTLSGGAHLGILSQSITVLHSLNRWTTDGAAPNTGTSGYAQVPGTFTVTIPTPTVNADTALYMQPALFVDNGWYQNDRSVLAFLPSLTLGGSLFRRPIKVPGTTITVVFDKSGKD